MKQRTVAYCSLLIFSLSLGVCNAQDANSGCGRTAYMGKCENLALPDDYEEINNKYLDCLGEQMNFVENGEVYITPTTDDETVAKWEQALENCKNLKPDYGRSFSTATSEVMVSLCESWIASIFTCDRFHIVNHALVQAYRENMELSGLPVKEDKSKIPQYFFEATYDCARDPVVREREDQYGNPIEDELWPAYLTVRMYFDGEQKELVKEWTVSSPNYFFSGLTNRMFKNESSLLRKEVPITDLLDDFEKKPVTCQVKPEKDEVGKGEEIEIVISDFRDAKMQPSREFNRIVVRADEGEILNGEKSEAGPDYKVFCLTGLPVKIRYEAPKNSETGSDRITVYNSCVILPPDRSPLRTTNPDKQIASNELRLEHQGWSGTINLTINERFNCNVDEKTSQLGRHRVTATDEKIIVANMSVGMDDFDLPTQSTNVGGKLRYISGDLMVRLLEDHHYKGSADKTECHNDNTGKWEWVSPGNWVTRHETMSGQASRDITAQNLSILIVKDIGYNKTKKQEMHNQAEEAARMMEIQRQLAEAGKNVDRKAIEEMKDQMVKMVQGDKNSNTFPVIIKVLLGFGGKSDPVSTTYDYVNYDVCLAKEDNESRSNTLDYPLITAVAAEFKGTFTRGDNGQDKITARVDSTETTRGSFYSDICPEKITITSGEITLERHKD